MAKNIKITESQFKRVVENITHDEIEETHLESEPFTDYSDKEQESLGHGEDHKTKNYKNPHLSDDIKEIKDEEFDIEDEEEEIDPLSKVGHFKENEFGEIELEDYDINDIFDYSGGKRRRFTGIIYYDAMVPATDDVDYDKKVAMAVLEYERKRMLNGETYTNDDSVFFRDRLY